MKKPKKEKNECEIVLDLYLAKRYNKFFQLGKAKVCRIGFSLITRLLDGTAVIFMGIFYLNKYYWLNCFENFLPALLISAPSPSPPPRSKLSNSNSKYNAKKYAKNSPRKKWQYFQNSNCINLKLKKKFKGGMTRDDKLVLRPAYSHPPPFRLIMTAKKKQPLMTSEGVS